MSPSCASLANSKRDAISSSETMDSLTPADIQAAAKRFLQKNRRTIIKLTGSGGQS